MDIKKRLREDIKDCRRRYRLVLTNITIPLMDRHGKLIYDENRIADSELGDPEPEEDNTHHPEFDANKTLDRNSSQGDGLKSHPEVKA